MSTVHVTNISHRTSEKEVRDFFSFCGKIQHLELTPTTKEGNAPLSATVTFERDSAAKTALLLDNTVLGDSPVKVESTASIDELAGSKGLTHDPEDHSDDIRQEDKPRSTILAEYLSHGYAIGDQALQKGIELDNTHGITQKFTELLQKFDAKLNATDTAKSVDSTYKISEKANQGANVLSRYFEAAIGTPTGQKIRDYYSIGAKQVLDVHNEARRLADLRKDETTACACGGDCVTCGCSTGQCKCKSCDKCSSKMSSSSSGQVREPHSVGGGKTKCSCSGNEGVCGCAAGQCKCADCPKSSEKSSGQVKEPHAVGGGKTKCSCGGDEGVCGCAPGQCNCADCPRS